MFQGGGVNQAEEGEGRGQGGGTPMALEVLGGGVRMLIRGNELERVAVSAAWLQQRQGEAPGMNTAFQHTAHSFHTLADQKRSGYMGTAVGKNKSAGGDPKSTAHETKTRNTGTISQPRRSGTIF